VAPEAGDAYLGTQGDIWDAQQDMLAAGIGALLCMIITAVVRRQRGRGAVLLAGENVSAPGSPPA
jgi:putative membrane protein